MAALGARPELWLPESGRVRLPVRGASMVPTLREGDFVEVRRAGRGDLYAGAVLAFARGEELVLHRLLAWDRERFLEMGDGQGRGNWHAWPGALALAESAERPGGREAWDTEAAKAAAGALARRMLRRHRATCLTDALPGALLRRAAKRLLRPWLGVPVR